MTYKVLVDVCIFQDVITKRKDWEGSQKVLKVFDRKYNEGWISSLTKPIIYFLSVKKIGEKNARKLVEYYTAPFAEIPLRQVVNEAAILCDLPEYEDNIQFESARQFHIDAIITRNKKHFIQKDIPVYSPEEFIDLQDSDDKSLNTEPVPFMDIEAQHHQIYNEIDDKITDIIANTGFILGKYVDEFEKGFAELQDAKYCIGVSSGTDALHIALMALGIGHGDAVIVPVNTFIATAEAVSLCGATPVFVDCDRFYNIDAEKLKLRISEVREKQNGLLKAVIPVHLYGQPANMNEIMALADEYGLKVVEDCCQAHLAKYDGKPVGSFGQFGAFSFYPGKNLGAYGEAGALITNDEALYEKARMIRQHGEIERYHHSVVGHNYRMSAFQGAALSVKMQYIAEWTEKRQENVRLYNKLLAGIEGIRTPKEMLNTSCVYHLYVIQTDDRGGLREYLEQNGISTGIHYPISLHLQEVYKDLGYKEGAFPVAERAAKRILSLPMFPELTEGQISYVCEKIKEYTISLQRPKA